MTADRHSPRRREIGQYACVRAAGISMCALALLAGCGGSAKAQLQERPDAATTEKTTLPPGVQLPDGRRLLDSGSTSGVQWFVSEGNDPEMGTCRSADFEPPIRRVSGPEGDRLPVDAPLELGMNNSTCTATPLTTSLDGRSDGSPMYVLAADTSQDREFSVMVAVTAPGVETVEMLDHEHVEAIVHPDAAHVAVWISRPPIRVPTAIVVIWDGARSYCVPDAGDYRCEDPTPESVRVLRVVNTRYGAAQLECGTRSAPCDERSAIVFPQCSDALDKYFNTPTFEGIDQRARALVGAPPSGDHWSEYGCGRTDSIPSP